MEKKKLTIEQRKKNEAVLISLFEKCREDQEFKNSFMQNPVSVLEDFSGEKVEFFGGKNKVVVEDQSNPNNIYLNIPANQEFHDIELTEKELELVAGGFVCGGLCIGIAIGVGLLIGYASTADHI